MATSSLFTKPVGQLSLRVSVPGTQPVVASFLTANSRALRGWHPERNSRGGPSAVAHRST